jgi:molecular chaperone GrpE
MPAGKKIEINADGASPQSSDAADSSENKAVPGAMENGSLPDAEAAGGNSEALMELTEKLETSEKKAQEYYERLLRVSADFENFKKRNARETEEFRKYANQSLVKDLLPILDNLELAIKSSSEPGKTDEASLREGVELTHREILKILQNYQVTPVEALGRPFDPNFHEAVMREESEAHGENTVVSELQKGYMMHDRLIRPAMVVVAVPKNSKANRESGPFDAND